MNRLFFFLLVFLVSCTTAFSQETAPAYVFQRTYKISFGKNNLTSFLIDYKGRNYFVTAKHAFLGNETQTSFTLSNDQGNIQVNADVFFHENPLIDIAVLRPHNMEKTDGISLVSAGQLKLGDYGFFFGFPLGREMSVASDLNKGFPFPLVKRANLSAVDLKDDVSKLWLDGINNPGFSGGPLFFRNRDNPADRNWYLAGVISSYFNQWNTVETPTGTFQYRENSGIIEAMSSQHIIEIIESIK